jgi:hypothetical protein
MKSPNNQSSTINKQLKAPLLMLKGGVAAQRTGWLFSISPAKDGHIFAFCLLPFDFYPD